MTAILALDLGTQCGFCTGTAQSHVSGTWNLKPSRFDGGGMRFIKLRTRLNEMHAAYPLSAVYFEEVRRHRGVDAAHIYGGLMAVVTEWCEEHKVPYSGLPVGEIKKSWTGMGNASKDLMMQSALDKGYEVHSDDEADAIAIFHLGMSKVGETVETLPAG
jgi:crossover junction endodeoxyribonuclease RuvC